MSDLTLWLEIEIYDKKGNLKSTTGRIPSHSFTIQFLKHIELLLYQEAAYGAGDDSTISATDITNTSRTLEDCFREDATGNKPLLACDAQEADDSYGIVVGTGTGAESNTTYVLDTKIAHGTGAGQFYHQGMAYSAGAVVGANVETQLTRAFNNSSGGSITIEEVALYCKSTGNNVFCIIRDLNTQAVADEETVSVKYTVTAAY